MSIWPAPAFNPKAFGTALPIGPGGQTPKLPADPILDFSDINISGTTLIDKSGNGNDGTLSGDTELPEKIVGGGPGGVDSLATQNSSLAYVDLLANGAIIDRDIQGFTVSYWSKDDVASFPGGGTYALWNSKFPTSHAEQQLWRIQHWDSSPAVDRMQGEIWQPGPVIYICQAPYTWSSAWKHVVFRYDRANLNISIWVNGVSGTPVAIADQPLGGDGVGSAEQWMAKSYPGEIALPRWYPRALTAAEIDLLYKEGL